MIDTSKLTEIKNRYSRTQGHIWKAYIEGRDHDCGSSFIMTGEENDINRGEDIELYGASEEEFDFIADAKQNIIRLIESIILNDSKTISLTKKEFVNIEAQYHSIKNKLWLNNIVRNQVNGATDDDFEFISNLNLDFQFLIQNLKILNNW